MEAYPTKYWHQLDDGRVQCDLCPRLCKLNEGQRGLCYIRGRENDEVVLYSYGRSSGFAVDPIEKKPLNHFLPGSSIFSFGTAGCNLSCKFCQNWDISKSREMDTLQSQATPENIALAAKDQGCDSVAFTYNDPVIFMEYAKDVAYAAHELGLKTVAVTAGYINPKPREEFFSFIDGANVDLKAFNNKFYKELTGGDLDSILDTLKYIKQETDTWLEITTLLIPGQNDSDRELNQQCEWITENLGHDVPLHFSAFHPDFKMRHIDRTPFNTLQRARDIALSKDLRYVYTGNVHDPLGSSTYCHNCDQLLIERDWFNLGQRAIDPKGKCHGCGAICSGIFS